MISLTHILLNLNNFNELYIFYFKKDDVPKLKSNFNKYKNNLIKQEKSLD